MSATSFWVQGEPATFATSGEASWKERLLECAPPPALAGRETGMDLRFSVSSLRRNGQPFDVDNLCDPVFVVVIRKAGWFGGRKTGLSWWSATKRLGQPPGCQIAIHVTRTISLPTQSPFLGPALFRADAREGDISRTSSLGARTSSRSGRRLDSRELLSLPRLRGPEGEHRRDLYGSRQGSRRLPVPVAGWHRERPGGLAGRDPRGRTGARQSSTGHPPYSPVGERSYSCNPPRRGARVSQ